MKKTWILLLVLILLLASCKEGNTGKNPGASKNSGTSQTGSKNTSGKKDKDSQSSDDFQDDTTDLLGELLVEATVENSKSGEILPLENSADILNPEVIKAAGANSQALAMRRSVLDSKDNLKKSGTVYYVSQKGSDMNDGKSPNAPYESLNRAFGSVKTGDTVLLERDSVFRLVSTVTLTNGVNYGAYGTGAKPEVWGSIENYADDLNWSPYNIRNVWSMSFIGSDVGIMVFNHGELAGNMEYYVRNLKKNGDFFFDDVQKVLYLYCDKGNPGKVYKDIEIGSRKILFRLPDGAQDITIDNIAFRYTGTFGIHGSVGCKNINITNCAIGWVGGSLFADGSNRYGNGIEFTEGCENLTVENCWIYQVYDAGFTFQITDPEGKEEERIYKNIKVKNNLIEYCSWAFEWWPNEGGCTIEDILVEGNIMRFTGYGWAGDSRTPSHVRGAWSPKNFEIKNFLITANIFDCSNGPVYGWALNTPDQLAKSLSGNMYYQRMPATADKNVFNFDYETQTNVNAVSNQKEFEAVVNRIDPKATLIKWLS